MTISRKFTSAATAIALAAASLGTVTTSASAGGYRGDGIYGHPGAYSHGYGRRDRGYRGDHYRGGRDRYYARHHKKRDNTGKYIAIGAAALMLGIIASEASRR